MRMMSFALTERQLLDGSKTVTRRTGWKNLKPGDRLLAVRKAMGLKYGEKVQPLCEIEVVSVRREQLGDMEDDDCAREGFPHMRAAQFIDMFTSKVASARIGTYDLEVTRIEFYVVPGSIQVEFQAALPL